MNRYSKLFILVAVISLLFSSCKKWEDPVFKAPEYTGKKANKTIADIKARHTVLGQNVLDSICEFSGQNFIVKAVVVSSDQGGNCYKYITVEDETGGIEIAIDQSGLFNEYPVGQIVYINCNGLVVGDYSNKYQIGWIYENSIGRINYMMLGNYLTKDGLPSMDNIKALSPCGGICELTSGDQINDELSNCLVTLKRAMFSSDCHGKQLASNELTCDRALSNFIVGTYPVVVRTSNYAYFRNRVIDATKEYDLTGILTKYKNEYQLTLRTSLDMVESPAEPQAQEVLVKKVDFANNTSSEITGWYNPSGNWTPVSSQAYGKIVTHDGYTGSSTSTTCDDWLVSPVINLNGVTDCYLKINHQLQNLTDPNIYQVYYSTTYSGGEIIESEWIPYGNLGNYPSSFGFSNELRPVPEGDFRIAIRYNHSNPNIESHRWSIKELNFYRIEWILN